MMSFSHLHRKVKFQSFSFAMSTLAKKAHLAKAVLAVADFISANHKKLAEMMEDSKEPTENQLVRVAKRLKRLGLDGTKARGFSMKSIIRKSKQEFLVGHEEQTAAVYAKISRLSKENAFRVKASSVGAMLLSFLVPHYKKVTDANKLTAVAYVLSLFNEFPEVLKNACKQAIKKGGSLSEGAIDQSQIPDTAAPAPMTRSRGYASASYRWHAETIAS